MLEEICYNISAALILIIIFSALMSRKMIKGNINKAFVVLVVFTFISSVLNTLMIYSDGNTDIPVSLHLVLVSAYYVVRNISFGLYLVYIIAITDTKHIFGKGAFRIFALAPMLITFLLCSSTLFSRSVFYIDHNGFFVRGRGINLLYLCCAVYVVYSIIIICLYRNNLGFKKSIALVGCAVGAIVAYFVGLLFPYYHFDLICYTLGILFIMLIVQNPELRVDSQSGLMRHASYFDDVKTAFRTKKKIAVIQINIAHFDQINSMLSYEKLSSFILRISSKLELMCRRLNIASEKYYLKEGKFRIILDPESRMEAERIAKVFGKIFNTNEKYADINMELSSVVCITMCPEDVDSFELLYDFETSLDKWNVTGEVIKAKNLLLDDEYSLISHMGEIIEEGLKNRSFEIYYQPIYNVQTKRFDAVEALLRLYDDKYGEILPEKFIPVAEKDESIYRLGEIVLKEVSKFVASSDFKSLGIRNVGVNISGIQCLRNGFASETLATIRKYGVDPSCISLEIKESQATESQTIFFDNITEVAKGGAKITLDNFGTGYTNIHNTSKMPINAIKIDKSITEIGRDVKKEAILMNSIEMVRGLDRKIIIVGVESDEMFRQFEFVDCDYIQGFYFSKPLPKDQLINFINGYDIKNKDK